jgi:RNA polymerase-binding protein DksA
VAKKVAKKSAAPKKAAKPASKAPGKSVVSKASAPSKTASIKAASSKPASSNGSSKKTGATPGRLVLMQGRPGATGKGAAKPSRASASAKSAAGASAMRRPGSDGNAVMTGKRLKTFHNPPPPPAPVPTDGKPRKNQAGLNARDLEHFRGLLLDKRRELVGDMSQMEREALRSASGTNLSNLPLHMADMGTDNYEQEFTLGLVEKERILLREINQALAKIQDGTYGICEGTGKPISKARLEAQPWARHSIEYARQREGGFIRR